MKTCQIAIALWQDDFNDLLKKEEGRFLDYSDLIHEVTTPDDTYIIAYYDWIDLKDELIEMYNLLCKELKEIRHSHIRIEEDGKFFSECKTHDERGTDECFSDIIGWKSEICIWQDVNSVLTVTDDSDADLNAFAREFEILENVLKHLKIDDIALDYDSDGLVLVARSAFKEWRGEEFYRYLIDEAFVFEDDGSVLDIDKELLEEFKLLASCYEIDIDDYRFTQNM